jgi:hypothetical protein
MGRKGLKVVGGIPNFAINSAGWLRRSEIASSGEMGGRGIPVFRLYGFRLLEAQRRAVRPPSLNRRSQQA